MAKLPPFGGLSLRPVLAKLRAPGNTPTRQRIADAMRQRNAEELEHALACEDPACLQCNGWVND